MLCFNLLGKVSSLLFLFLLFQDQQTCDPLSIQSEEIRVCRTGSGEVTVLLEAGLGDGVDQWGELPKRIGQFAKLVYYDRIGIGESSNRRHQEPITAELVSKVLVEIFNQEKIQPPVIVFGHSLGGLYAQYFARKYPEKVQGLILIESATSFEPRDGSYGPQASFSPGSIEDWEDKGTYASFEQLDSLRGPPNIPVTLIVADQQFGTKPTAAQKKLTEGWMVIQRKLAASFPEAKWVLAEGRGHYVQQEDPDLVISELKRMIAEILVQGQ